MRTITSDDGRTTITTPYMSLTDAAIYCQCPEATLAQAIVDRACTYHQVDQTIIFKVDDLDGFMKNHEVLSRDNFLEDPPDDDAPEEP